MDIFQRRWEMQRREYLELLNEWVRIDRRWMDVVKHHDSTKTAVISDMVDNYLTAEMIAHALMLSVRDVEEIVDAFKVQRSEMRTWLGKSREFKERTGKEVLSPNSETFYRVRREYSYGGPGEFVLSDEPFDSDLYSLYPDFVREQDRYGF